MYVSVLYRFVSIFDATHIFSPVFVSLNLGSVFIHGGGGGGGVEYKPW